ncbi:DUF3365 domain-containing protein [Roseiconus lacunae]|uniref:Tll0287-like domain-containing protein n=1 Tax=Roseiconus lacunae TaxID=2605694 RepID=UPI001E4A2EB8|nr:DUF3365 domain-containing protein [Roseiconus lacunae]MCD0462886.1 DUF3365 domain-containing protein [Roseiconus lacunae]WRQ50467.1 DUF3365 domain-containing protein [Stieleria sp. HD01]
MTTSIRFLLACVALMTSGLLMTLSGCSNSEASSSTAGSITPRQFADGVHAVMMADRTVYATHVVTNLKKQDAPVTADEYWQDTENAIPLPAQMFRMGAELVDENPEAGFTYALRSKWPLNEQHKAKTDLEKEALDFISDNPGDNFYGEEELGGKKFFVAVYPDRAVAEACWSCHNDHPSRGEDYPDFAKDDVMGGVLVRVPM